MLIDRGSHSKQSKTQGGFRTGRWFEHSLGCNCLGRRNFIKLASGAALADLEAKGSIKITGAMYNLERRGGVLRLGIENLVLGSTID